MRTFIRHSPAITRDWLLNSFDWSEPESAQTKYGPAILRKTEPDQRFWQAWRTSKDVLRSLGVLVSKDDDSGEWSVLWFDRANPQVSALLSPPAAPVASPIEKESKTRKWGTIVPQGEAVPLSPQTLKKLYQYQPAAVYTHLRAFASGNFSLDASETGLGKTHIALSVVLELGLEFGVVCPANAVSKWVDTAQEIFGLSPEFVLSYDKLRGGRTGFVRRIDLGQSVQFKWEHASRPMVLIFDEIHNCAGWKSLNSRLLEAALKCPNTKVLGLSATVADSPLNLRVLGQALGLHKGYNFWTWAKQNGCREGFFGGLEFTKNTQRRVEILQNIHAQIFPAKGARLTREDCKLYLPKQIVLVESIDVSETSLPQCVQEELKLLAAIEEADLEQARERAGEDEFAGVNGMTLTLRDCQRAELLKVPFMVAEAEQALEQNLSVIHFVKFSATERCLLKLRSSGQGQVGLVTGGQNRFERDRILHEFQSNTLKELIVKHSAGSSSIDLHDTDGRHPRYSLVTPTYKSKELLQILGRTDRVDKKSTDTVKLLFNSEGVERKIQKAVQRKLDNLSLLNDGDLSPVNLSV
jgi:superfamily II DNA or RNA helicase